MGGYGSGRSATRQSEATSYRFSVALPAALLRQLREQRVSDQAVAGLKGTAQWTRRGEPDGAATYIVHERGGGPWVELSYTARGAEVHDRLQLVERLSNLGRGVVVYWRCACGQLARVLYLGHALRWRCRRCVPVVYASSRESDARVSRLLRGIFDDLASEAAEYGFDLATMGAAQLASQARRSSAGLLLAIKALNRLGMGITRPERARRWHGSAGRPRPR